MSLFPRIINVTGQKATGNVNFHYTNVTAIPKSFPIGTKWQTFLADSTSNIQVSSNVQIHPAGITIAANAYTNKQNTIVTAGASYLWAGAVALRSNAVTTSGNYFYNIANVFIVHVEPSSTANTQPPLDSLSKVITIAPAGSDAGGNTYGGYREWFTADADVFRPNAGGTIINSDNVSRTTANGLVYVWKLGTSNTNLPWQFNNSSNTTDIEIIFCY